MRNWIGAAVALVVTAAPGLHVGSSDRAWDHVQRESGWRALFDGQSLSGWRPKIRGYAAGEDPLRTFRVAEGAIQVRYDQYGPFAERFGHLFYQEEFSYYRLRVEYRFVGSQAEGGPGWAVRNSGVMVHGERPEAMAIGQDFPASIEVQFLGGDGTRPRPTSNLCTPGTNVVIGGELITRHCTNSTSATYHGDEWVTAEVEVCGNRLIRHWLGGKPVMQYGSPQLDDRDPHARSLMAATGSVQLGGGTISLQSESHPIDFRRVEIRPLSEGTCGDR